MPSYKKDPGAELDYAIDWSAWMPGGDTITEATWTVPPGITKTDESVQGLKAVVWLSGGTPGVLYPVTCHITTSQGRIDDRTIHIEVQQR